MLNHQAIMTWSDQFHSADWVLAAWLALGAYALGCFSTGYYFVRCWTGQDIRQLGSGNAGARNVGRLLGWHAFLITLAGDFGKGAFAVWAAQKFTGDPQLAAVAMFAVVAGHILPVQLGFRGGKGVATLLGAVTVYDVRLTLAFALLFGVFFVMTRRSILPGLLGVGLLPAAAWGLSSEPFSARAAAEAFRISCVAGLVVLAHRRNITEEILLLLERRNMENKRPTNS